MTRKMNNKKFITVIIPVRRKENLLKKVINRIPEFCEIIIVSSSKEHLPKNIPIKNNLRIIICNFENRSDLMNEGTKISKGNFFFFLHPDTFVDKNVFFKIKKLPSHIIGGGVFITFDKKHPLLNFISWSSNNIRMRLFKIIYGDQCIFVRKEIFQRMKGYKSMMLFEDYEFSSRLKKQGELIFVSSAQTSARRFLKKGIFKQIMLNWYLVFLYWIGVSDYKLRRYYGK